MTEENVKNKIFEVDKNLSVITERLTNYLNKLDDLEKYTEKEKTLFNKNLEDLNKNITELKKEVVLIRDETRDNSKNRKVTNSVAWLSFTSVIAIFTFFIREKFIK